MKIEFIQTEAHVMDFQKAHFEKIFWFKGLLIFIIVTVLINLFVPIYFNGFNWQQFLSSFIPLIIIGLIWWGTMKIIRRRLYKGKTKELMIGQRTVEFTDKSVFYKTPISETAYDRKDFSKIHSSTLSYFLYLGSEQAIIIPKSAFENEIQKSEFEQLINEKIR